MGNRALILYASDTGNTARIASEFQQVLGEYGWEVTCLRLEKDTDIRSQGVYVDDYSLLLLGSPVISSGPSPVVARKLALVELEPPRLYRSELVYPGSFFRPDFAPLGITFVTYSGDTYGPMESEPALETMGLYLKYLFIPTVGRFACPARKEGNSTIELIGAELNVSPVEAANLVGRFEQCPEDPMFRSVSEDVLALLRQGVSDRHGGAVPLPADLEAASWHKGLDSRPNARDLTKARIFLSEILEDYFFEDGTAKDAGSVYTCIG